MVDYCNGFIGISAVGQKASAQSALLDRPQVTTGSSYCDSRDILGEVLVIKLMKVGDTNKLQKYILSNCKLDNSISGRFDMSFNLNKQGEVTIVLAANELPKQVKLQITRGLMNGMKLIGGNLNIEYPYQLSIIFIKGRVHISYGLKRTWAIPLFVACKKSLFFALVVTDWCSF